MLVPVCRIRTGLVIFGWMKENISVSGLSCLSVEPEATRTTAKIKASVLATAARSAPVHAHAHVQQRNTRRPQNQSPQPPVETELDAGTEGPGLYGLSPPP